VELGRQAGVLRLGRLQAPAELGQALGEPAPAAGEDPFQQLPVLLLRLLVAAGGARLAKRAGLLHDVGKGMTHDHEGTHVELGYELCRKYNEHPVVLNSIRAHHDEEPHGSPEAFLVTASDAISGSRPGARREMFETYVKRLEKLEKIALDFPGVERCFAVQAGREVRVMVEPDKVSDEEMTKISEKVARRFEEELQYPGQIKVVLIRETRAVDFAR
jgi:ribonuclease Y